MKGSLKVNVAAGGIDYIKKIVKAGSSTQMKFFNKLPVEEQNELIFETLAKKYVRICVEQKNKDFTFCRVGGKIEISRNVTILSEKKKDKVKAILLSIVPKNIKSNYIEYSLEINLNEYDENELVLRRLRRKSKDFQGGDFSVSHEDSLLLKNVAEIEFWKKFLPHELIYQYQDSTLLVNFVDVLNAHGYTEAIGIECAYMKSIYHEAIKRYPLFKNLLQFEQVNLLNNAMCKAHRRKRALRSTSFFARATFEILAEKGLHNLLWKDGKTYEKVKDLRNNYKSIRMVEYEYKAKKEILTTCFLAFDLWNVLTTSVLDEVV